MKEASNKVVEIGSAELSELEQTKMENFALKHGLLQQQLQRIGADRTAYVKQIEEAHPGYKWDEQKGLVAQ